MTQDHAERRRHIQSIRQRLEELDQHFGIRFPVYVMLTKCDLIAGFSEFFENLGRDERDQVWGMTFPVVETSGERSPIEMFANEYDELVSRLSERLIWRLSQERDVARRAMIYRFPKQMASLRDLLSEFLGEVFQASRYGDTAMVRGVYLCSGTQEGAPIDRILGALTQTFALSPQALATPSGPGKSFFISDMMQRVAFPEAGLAGTNRQQERRRAWIQRGAYAGALGLVLLALVAWGVSYTRNLDYIDNVAALTAESEALVSQISPANIDPLEPMAALNALQDLAHRSDEGSIQTTFLQGFGLSQEGKLSDVGDAAYRRMLVQAFLPRIMLRMEEQMQRGGPSPDYAYAALRAYLSLDSRDHYDADMINAFLRLDWLENIRREISTEQREQLSEHLTAVLEQRPTPLPLPLDDALIERTQRDLRRMPLDERIYGRLLRRPLDESIRGFNVRDAAGGDAADLVLVRKSGRALSEPLPPLFTKQGYQSTFKSANKELTRDLLSETWVLGQEEVISTDDANALAEKVRSRYLEDFAQRYTELILDVDLAPFNSSDEAARMFRILSQDDSPLLLLLLELERQTALESVTAEAGALERTSSALREAEERARELLGGSSSSVDTVATTLETANIVEQRFASLNGLVQETDGRPRPIDHVLELIGKLYLFMSTVSSEQAGEAIPPHVVQQGQALVQELRLEAENQPDLVGDLLNAAASRTAVLAFGGAVEYLNDLWRSGPLPFCRNAIQGRYPIQRSAGASIRIDDFSRFFGYNQIMDSFFNEHLKNYIDTSERPWKARTTGNTPIRLSDETIRAFERADAIKQTFFSFGGAVPTVGFNMSPLDMSANISRFVLNLEGTEISWEHGPQVSSFMQWPGPNPGSGIRIEMQDTRTNRSHMLRKQGPWAWFRVLDESNIRATTKPEHFEVEFTIDGNVAFYELVARSAFNPFRSRALEQFTCPDTL
jgi:type VI secretion system protein ImpL